MWISVGSWYLELVVEKQLTGTLFQQKTVFYELLFKRQILFATFISWDSPSRTKYSCPFAALLSLMKLHYTLSRLAYSSTDFHDERLLTSPMQFLCFGKRCMVVVLLASTACTPGTLCQCCSRPVILCKPHCAPLFRLQFPQHRHSLHVSMTF